MSVQRVFTLELSEVECNHVLNALNEVPTKIGMPLIQKILMQANAHLAASVNKEAPAEKEESNV